MHAKDGPKIELEKLSLRIVSPAKPLNTTILLASVQEHHYDTDTDSYINLGRGREVNSRRHMHIHI